MALYEVNGVSWNQAEQLQQHGQHDNELMVCRISSDVDPEALGAALQNLVHRHHLYVPKVEMKY